jgi:hypothetical protein
LSINDCLGAWFALGLVTALLAAPLMASSVRIAEAGVDVWTSNGPEGGLVRAVAIDPTTPTTLYVGTSGGGVFKSTSGEANWSAANTGLTTTSIQALAIDPTTPSALYVGTVSGGVFKSTTGGDSWIVVSAHDLAHRTETIAPWVFHRHGTPIGDFRQGVGAGLSRYRAPGAHPS